jgi:integrin beta 3
MPDVNALGERIVGTVRSFVTRSLAPLEARLAALEARPAPEKGEDGKDGVDGKSVTLEEVQKALSPLVAEWTDDHLKIYQRSSDEAFKAALKEYFAKLPTPQNGKDGRDGTSVTLEDVQTFLDASYAKWALEADRRMSDLIQRAIERIPIPKDGKDGEDGADGFDLRHFSVTQVDERSFVLRFKDLRREVAEKITLPVPIPRAIWKDGETYRKGDIVTWGGSAFIKQTDEPGGKPEESTHWRLFVKRGRDGKDGAKGEKGDPGKVGRNGRDLTQLGQDGSRW